LLINYMKNNHNEMLSNYFLLECLNEIILVPFILINGPEFEFSNKNH